MISTDESQEGFESPVWLGHLLSDMGKPPTPPVYPLEDKKMSECEYFKALTALIHALCVCVWVSSVNRGLCVLWVNLGVRVRQKLPWRPARLQRLRTASEVIQQAERGAE